MVIHENVLSKTIVGSHVWNMNHENSDIDIICCYLADSKDLLIHSHLPKNIQYKKGNDDITEIELKYVIDGLIKNNINMLIAIYSPLILFEKKNILTDLRSITDQFLLSKQAYNSIAGMSYNNYRKYIEPNGDENTPKTRRMIARTLLLGITLFTSHKIIFPGKSSPYYPNGIPVYSTQELTKLLEEFEQVYDKSVLREKPEQEGIQKLYDYLFDLRIDNLSQDIRFKMI